MQNTIQNVGIRKQEDLYKSVSLRINLLVKVLCLSSDEKQVVIIYFIFFSKLKHNLHLKKRLMIPKW
jgi:hypothetical protein